MVYCIVVGACCLGYGGREFESRSLHLKPETKLREERGLSGCRKGLKTVPLAQALLSLKPAKTNNKQIFFFLFAMFSHIVLVIELKHHQGSHGNTLAKWLTKLAVILALGAFFEHRGKQEVIKLFWAQGLFVGGCELAF